jgi:hypothetical protein
MCGAAAIHCCKSVFGAADRWTALVTGRPVAFREQRVSENVPGAAAE